MSPINRTDADFVFQPDPPIPAGAAYPPVPPAPAPESLAHLGALAALVGEWKGTGLNCIWRPHFPAAESDRFLEVNLTAEKITFSPIPGEIPNRGLLQQDIAMNGITYLQQISEQGTGAGLHIEPGIWAIVPETTDPAETPSVVRMASIPHGTVILAQGTVAVSEGPPPIADNNIIPFGLNGAQPQPANFAAAEAIFTQLDLATPNPFRKTSPGVTESMLENPNSVLQSLLSGGPAAKETTTLRVATNDTPVPGGGTANTAFLEAGNAVASLVSATFWIETLEGTNGGPGTLRLQYSQTVMLDFNGLRWPHVTVATLTK